MTAAREFERMRAMSTAELSSLATALEELTRRVVAVAEECRRAEREDTAADLFAVEGLLDAARRRLDKVVASLPST